MFGNKIPVSQEIIELTGLTNLPLTNDGVPIWIDMPREMFSGFPASESDTSDKVEYVNKKIIYDLLEKYLSTDKIEYLGALRYFVEN